MLKNQLNFHSLIKFDLHKGAKSQVMVLVLDKKCLPTRSIIQCYGVVYIKSICLRIQLLSHSQSLNSSIRSGVRGQNNHSPNFTTINYDHLHREVVMPLFSPTALKFGHAV